MGTTARAVGLATGKIVCRGQLSKKQCRRACALFAVAQSKEKHVRRAFVLPPRAAPQFTCQLPSLWANTFAQAVKLNISVARSAQNTVSAGAERSLRRSKLQATRM